MKHPFSSKIPGLLLLLVMIFSSAPSFSQLLPKMRDEDNIRIHEAMTIAEKYGNKLFKDFNKPPFAIILVTDSIEFLLNHSNPSSDFTLLEYDTRLKTNIYYRKSLFSKHFLATFPAVNGISCIVAGTPENTNKSSSDWVITLLHEHFHQFQSFGANYYEDVNKLDLSGGDQTGMWMLNYNFPYTDSVIIKQFEKYSIALDKAIAEKNRKKFKSATSDYFLQRSKLKQLLTEKDYRYFSLQVWQEGLARNTEYEFSKLLLKYKPTDDFVRLPDYIPFRNIAEQLYTTEIALLTNQKLNDNKRVSFYSIGFAEGLLLNRLNPGWRKKYMEEKFFIEKYWEK